MLAASTTDTMAQTRIRFARGRSSATLNGTLASGSARAYVVDVRRNQSMTVNVTSGNNNIQIDIDDVDGHIEYGDGYSQIYTKNNGNHSIILKNEGGRSTKYSMTVTVR
jgi:hypothetical protein